MMHKPIHMPQHPLEKCRILTKGGMLVGISLIYIHIFDVFVIFSFFVFAFLVLYQRLDPPSFFLFYRSPNHAKQFIATSCCSFNSFLNSRWWTQPNAQSCCDPSTIWNTAASPPKCVNQTWHEILSLASKLATVFMVTRCILFGWICMKFVTKACTKLTESRES